MWWGFPVNEIGKWKELTLLDATMDDGTMKLQGAWVGRNLFYFLFDLEWVLIIFLTCLLFPPIHSLQYYCLVTVILLWASQRAARDQITEIICIGRRGRTFTSAEKKWDLLVIVDTNVLVTRESHVLMENGAAIHLHANVRTLKLIFLYIWRFSKRIVFYQKQSQRSKTIYSIFWM